MTAQPNALADHLDEVVDWNKWRLVVRDEDLKVFGVAENGEIASRMLLPRFDLPVGRRMIRVLEWQRREPKR